MLTHSKTSGSSFSGLFTRAETGQIIKGRSRSRGSGSKDESNATHETSPSPEQSLPAGAQATT